MPPRFVSWQWFMRVSMLLFFAWNNGDNCLLAWVDLYFNARGLKPPPEIRVLEVGSFVLEVILIGSVDMMMVMTCSARIWPYCNSMLIALGEWSGSCFARASLTLQICTVQAVEPRESVSCEPHYGGLLYMADSPFVLHAYLLFALKTMHQGFLKESAFSKCVWANR